MSHIKSPYDRNGGEGGASSGFIAIVASVVLHAGALVAFIVLGSLHNSRNLEDNTIRVQLIGPDAPQAPAAPKDLPVDPDQKGPDVREAPPSTPEPPVQPTPEPAKPVTPPTDVIPLGPKSPDKPPEIKKTPVQPPKPTPPKVEPPKPKPPPKPKTPPNPNLDGDIEKMMEEFMRKKEADDAAADDPDSRLWDFNRPSGQGEGSSSESGGSTRGERIDPEQARYYAHIRDIISHNWLAPSDVNSMDIVAAHKIVIQPDGQVASSSLVKSSGDESFDLSVERAIKKSSPLPPLPAAFGGAAIPVQLNFSLADLQRGR